MPNKLLILWNRYEKIDENSITSNDIPTLKMTRYNFILKAKKERDTLISSNAITLIFTILVSFLTITYTIANSISDRSDNAIKRVDDVKIEVMKVGIDKKNESELATIKSDMENIYKNEGNLAIKDINEKMDSIYPLLKAIVYIIIAILLINFISIKFISGKASYYETLVIMIDERLKGLEKENNEKDNTKKLEEIEKIMEETKAEVGTLIKVFNGLKR